MKMIVKTKTNTIEYIVTTPIPEAIISQLDRWSIDKSFLDIVCPTLDTSAYNGWKDVYKSTLVAKLALIRIKAHHLADTIYEAILHELPEDHKVNFSRGWWKAPTEFNMDEMGLLSSYTKRNTSKNYLSETEAVWAVTEIASGGVLGKQAASFLADTYDDYLLGNLDVEATAKRFAQNGAVSNIIFSYLKMDTSLLEAYRKMPGNASKLSKTKQVVLATAVVIDAVNSDDALAQLDRAIETVTSDLKNQIMKQWPK